MTTNLTDELRKRYVAAICAFNDARDVLAQHAAKGTVPTDAELLQEEDARLLWKLARQEYFRARENSN